MPPEAAGLITDGLTAVGCTIWQDEATPAATVTVRGGQVARYQLVPVRPA
ncbi:MAG TPA: hypothetical protein VMC03_06250 [Streptosporangiaceae bacterium]|nr:hypothetical protein [Streptosporangiaceae bacterium]